MLLSICIPTYNRSSQLDNCLNSILVSNSFSNENDFEICISDNNSKDKTEEVVKKYTKYIKINYNKNSQNLGFAKNAIKVISMAKGKYSWLIGDDDLILPKTIKKILNILRLNSDINFFFINSYYLNSNFLEKFPTPFDTTKLQLDNLEYLSKVKNDKIVPFWELINPKVSWEFLIGIFLVIFKTSDWIEASSKIPEKKIVSTDIWSNFENTCFFPIVNALAFKNQKSYICSEPLSVNIIGFREWKNYYDFIEIVRLPELLDFYRNLGLPFFQYLMCKNFALRNFFNYLLKVFINKKSKGREYINFKDHCLKNMIFPNVYFSFFTFFYRKLKFFFKSFN